MPRYIDADELHKIIENGVGTPALKLFADCCVELAPITDVAPRLEVAREIIGEVFSYVHGNEKLTENIPEIELFKFGMLIGELEKKYDPKSKKIITDNARKE